MTGPTVCPHCGASYRHRQPWELVLTTPGAVHRATTCEICKHRTEHAERQPFAFEESEPRLTITRLAAGAAIVACLLAASIVWS